MTVNNAIEQAYKNGYEEGRRESVRHSEWVTDDSGKHYCKRCGTYMKIRIYHDSSDDNIEYPLDDFCSRCGSNMTKS